MALRDRAVRLQIRSYSTQSQLYPQFTRINKSNFIAIRSVQIETNASL